MDPAVIPRLRTERLDLREWRPTDHEPFAQMNADPLVIEHLPRALDRSESDAFIARIEAAWLAHRHGLWALVRRDDDTFIGFVGLNAPTFDAHFTPAVEVGWRLAPAAWGNGYATEGAQAALRYAFDTLALGEVVSYTVPANVRSRAVMQRLGMTHDEADDFDHPSYLTDERICRHVLYRLSRSTWSARRPPSTELTHRSVIVTSVRQLHACDRRRGPGPTAPVPDHLPPGRRGRRPRPPESGPTRPTRSQHPRRRES